MFVSGNKYYLPAYLDEYIYKIVDKQLIGYFDNSLLESDDENYSFFLDFEKASLLNYIL